MSINHTDESSARRQGGRSGCSASMSDASMCTQRTGGAEARPEPSEEKQERTETAGPNKAVPESTAFTGNFAQAMALSALFGGFSPMGMANPFSPFLPNQLPWSGAGLAGSPRHHHHTNGTISAPVAKPAVPACKPEPRNRNFMESDQELHKKRGSLFVPYKQGEKRKLAEDEPPQETKSKSMRGTSKYRGVTRHRRSGRWEAHIWVPETNRQLYLGGYKLEEDAATAYDIVAIKCKGIHSAKANFPKKNYHNLLQLMQKVSLEEIIMAVRRQSEGFTTCKTPLLPGKYIGVRRAKDHYEAFLSLPGSPEIYLGQFKTEEAAAKAVDRSLIRIKGSNAQINFRVEDYPEEMAEYLRRNNINEPPKAEGHQEPLTPPQSCTTRACELSEANTRKEAVKSQAKGA